MVVKSNLGGRGLEPVGSLPAMYRSGTYDLAGNVREWCFNGTHREGQRRFILGGGWNDPAYSFADPYAQSPFDRSSANGFRCIRYLDPDENLESVTRDIEVPYRDFGSEEPVAEEIFQVYLNQYAYDRTDLEASIEGDDEEEDWVREKISFNDAYAGERMFAYLYLPRKGKPPYEAVVYFPGSYAIDARDSSSLWAGDLSMFDFVIKSGRAVMYPIYKGTYERGDELESSYPEATTFYKEHVIMWVKDFSRSIDYLETREDIDTAALAYYGVSWGGFMGNIMPAVERRLKASVLYVAGLSQSRALPDVDAIHYVGRVTLPVLMLNGEYDFYYPLETSQRPMFDLLGTPEEHKKWLTYPGSHTVPRAERVKETLDWLDRYLGPVE